MNLPNKLTVLRVILIPFFLLFVLLFKIPHHMVFALIVFAAASITDWFDGKIARKHNLVTTFGKFLDPLADKLLVMTALICFTFERWIDPVAVVLILAREFMVTGLRLVVASEGVVVAAGIWGNSNGFHHGCSYCYNGLQIVNPAEKEALISLGVHRYSL
ncbi:MAG: CDP-diacylglycerol--glycerol-3-phosphate 3-phosphatidyltransferase [Ruminococcus bicirculans (ex Wegman et al. 2014)]